jgi:uncharacterized membrane protein YcjF (UPF0283 family)
MTIRRESREKFEKQGRALTMHHLQLDNMPPAEKREIVEWLEEKDREAVSLERTRFRLTMIIAILAAIGAWVAAWPVLRAWITN